MKEEGFVEMVRQWWNEYCFSGSLSFILVRKLKALKDDLKKWIKEEFGDLAFRKKSLLSELLGLDARENLLGLSQENQTCRIQIKGEIVRLASVGAFFLWLKWAASCGTIIVLGWAAFSGTRPKYYE